MNKIKKIRNNFAKYTLIFVVFAVLFVQVAFFSTKAINADIVEAARQSQLLASLDLTKEGDVYLINDENDRIELSNFCNNGGQTAGLKFKQTANLDFKSWMDGSTSSKGILGIGTSSYPFCGTYDGGNFSIANFKGRGTGNIGYFSYIGDGAKILNVTLESGEITCVAGSSAGALVGQAKSGASFNIKHCLNLGVQIKGASNASCTMGGLIGYISDKASDDLRSDRYIEECANFVSITASCAKGYTTIVGGIVGRGKDSYLYRCMNKGNININSVVGTAYAGGIMGYSNGDGFSNCHNMGDVKSSTSNEVTMRSGTNDYNGTEIQDFTGRVKWTLYASSTNHTINYNAYAGGCFGIGKDTSSYKIYIASFFNMGDISGCKQRSTMHFKVMSVFFNESKYYADIYSSYYGINFPLGGSIGYYNGSQSLSGKGYTTTTGSNERKNHGGIDNDGQYYVYVGDSEPEFSKIDEIILHSPSESPIKFTNQWGDPYDTGYHGALGYYTKSNSYSYFKSIGTGSLQMAINNCATSRNEEITSAGIYRYKSESDGNQSLYYSIRAEGKYYKRGLKSFSVSYNLKKFNYSLSWADGNIEATHKTSVTASDLGNTSWGQNSSVNNGYPSLKCFYWVFNTSKPS